MSVALDSSNPSASRTGRRPVSRGAFLCRAVTGALVALLVVSVLGFRAAVAWWRYPSGVDRAPAACTWIEDRHGTPLAAFASLSGEWHLPLAEREISPHLLDAIVAVEDARFYEHGGVDWRSALGAMWQDLTTLSLHRGASTITMQLH